jgi:hypothetical protein
VSLLITKLFSLGSNVTFDAATVTSPAETTVNIGVPELSFATRTLV